jgi:MFS family permease
MSSEPIRFGPVELAPGVSKTNLLTYLYAAFAGVALTSFVSIIMPYVLNVNIGLPIGEQGTVAGNLIFYGELVLLAMSGLFGTWSDRFGRRAILFVGLLLMAAGYVMLGYAETVPQLIVTRIFITFGIAAVSVMVSTIQIDYPAEQSRGKLAAMASMLIGLGAVMIGIVFTRLPVIFAGMGYTDFAASRMTMFTMTAFCLLTACIIRFGLKGGPPPQVSGKAGMRALIRDGLGAARENPRVLLCYASGFIGRADLVVVGTFYTLWLTQAGIEAGLSNEEAAKNAGAMFALVMTAALLWAPILGFLSDRFDRTLILSAGLALALLGYCMMGVLGDPQGSWLIPSSILLGIGQMSVTLATSPLLGQQSPAALRGAIVGTYSVFGAGGILFVTSVGGRIYDAISPGAPFILVGLLNGLLAIFGFWLYRSTQAKPSSKPSAV